MSKNISMKNKNEGATIASTHVEAIKDFLVDFYPTRSLYKSISLAYAELDNLSRKPNVEDADIESIKEVMQQALMMVELLEPFEKGDE